MVIMTVSPGDFVNNFIDEEGGRGDCTAACVTVYIDCVCGKLALCDIYYVMTTTYFYFVYFY